MFTLLVDTGVKKPKPFVKAAPPSEQSGTKFGLGEPGPRLIEVGRRSHVRVILLQVAALKAGNLEHLARILLVLLV